MDYDQIGRGYAEHRQPDPHIERQLWAALGDARSVVNVGAGTGSYEPRDRELVAVEPSATMIAQRPAGDTAEVVQARAEALPFADRRFDAAMAVLTIHHWQDWRAGVAEMCRVAGRVVILTWIPEPARSFWLYEYLPWVLDLDPQRFPSIASLQDALGGRARVQVVPLDHACRDGFLCAYWRRPRAYLDPRVRQCMSVFGTEALEARAAPGLAALAADLDSERWDRRWGHLRELEEIDLGYRLVVATGAGS